MPEYVRMRKLATLCWMRFGFMITAIFGGWYYSLFHSGFWSTGYGPDTWGEIFLGFLYAVPMILFGMSIDLLHGVTGSRDSAAFGFLAVFYGLAISVLLGWAWLPDLRLVVSCRDPT